MAAKHMKLLLAALALLLALAATFAHARVGVPEDRGFTGVFGRGPCNVEHCVECMEGESDTCKRCDPPYTPSGDQRMCVGDCDVQYCAACEEGKPDTCASCDPMHRLSEDKKQCKDSVVSPPCAVIAVLAACAVAASMLAL